MKSIGFFCILAFAATFSFSTKSAQNPLSTKLTNVWESIPSSQSVTKYLFPDARNTIIHVKQIHTRTTPSLSSQKDKDLLDKIQNEIFLIGDSLKSKLGLDCVYMEGTSKAGIADVEHAVESFEKLKSIPGGADIVGQFEQNPTIKHNKLIFHSGLKPRPAEDEALNRIAGEQMRQFQLQALMSTNDVDVLWNKFITGDHVVFKQREDQVLIQIAEDYKQNLRTSVYSLLVFGGAHDFTDNVKRWNETNDLKFNLVTITPTSYSTNK